MLTTIARAGTYLKKKVPAFALWALAAMPLGVMAQPGYVPAPENVKNRLAFSQDRFGLFIHWGLYSQMADGEWVQYHQRIPAERYARLADNFNPTQFNAEAWVLMAKNAGMKYITITSKHHDGFCLWDSKLTSFDVVDATPYKKDIIKQMADACQKHGIKLCLYYSLLDWKHPDYYTQGDHYASKVMGAKPGGDFSKYVDNMCGQLTELLTNYGPIHTIWFDGEWESLKAPWNFDKIYSTIHKAQPGTMIGNNHHRNVRPGEDFQMFEKDLPGANSHGWVSEAAAVANVPLEMCETMNDSWGFKIKDGKFKSTKYLVQLLVKSGGHNANLLLNVGPMGNGVIQKEFQDTLARIGQWLQVFGPTVYGTQGGATRTWGATTLTKEKVYVHLLKPEDNAVLVPLPAGFKVKTAKVFRTGAPVKFTNTAEGLLLQVPASTDPLDAYDRVVELTK